MVDPKTGLLQIETANFSVCSYKNRKWQCHIFIALVFVTHIVKNIRSFLMLQINSYVNFRYR
jgi:hypothetical protein